MILLNMKRIAGICVLVVVAACGTEGGNPHRNSKNPAEGQKTEDKAPREANAPIESGIETSPAKGMAPACDFSFALTPADGSPQFYFSFDVAESKDTRSSAGAPLLPNAKLSRDVTDPATGTSSQETKPISDWQPAQGSWLLSVTLTDPSGTDQDKNYCTATLTLGADVTSTTSVTISVRGLNNPTQ
jgi:hypothetical protein